MSVAGALGVPDKEKELVELLTGLYRISVALMNEVVLAYTVSGGIAGATGNRDDVEGFLDSGVEFYGIFTALNAVFMAAGVFVGVVQTHGHYLPKAKVVATPNITLDDGGIKLQCGNSSINITTTGITISGPTVNLFGGSGIVMPGAPSPGLVVTGTTTALSGATTTVSGTNSVTVSGTNTTVSGTGSVSVDSPNTQFSVASGTGATTVSPGDIKFLKETAPLVTQILSDRIKGLTEQIKNLQP
jgi:hypothetical protein